MLRRNKTLSIVMTLCLCLAMLAPVFVMPQAADASSTYTTLKAPTVDPENTNADLGQVMVEVPMAEAVYGSIVTISLPTDLTIPGNVYVSNDAGTCTGSGIYLYVPDDIGNATNGFNGATFNIDGADVDTNGALKGISGNSFDLKVKPTGTGASRFILYVNGVNMKNTSGDMNVDFSAPSNSGYTSASVLIAKSSSDGNTTTTVKSVKNLTSGSSLTSLDNIDILESAPATLKHDGTGTIEAKITTHGVTWNKAKITDFAVATGWGFTGAINLTGASIDNDDKTLNITVPTQNGNEAGKITISKAFFTIDETDANLGDITVNFSGADMTEQDVVVAKYVDYGVTVSEKTTKDLTAGDVDQKLGEFVITEGAPGSLVAGRTVTLTLPDGLIWKHDADSSTCPYNSTNVKNDDGDSVSAFTDFKVNNSGNERVLTMTVDQPSITEGRTIRFKDMKIDVKPSFTGPVEITVAGSAGVAGTVKVADVKPAVKLTANGVSNIVMGGANQKVADIVLTETDGGAIFKETGHDQIVMQLDEGYKFTKKPVYTVEGDLEIDSVKLQNSDRELKITLDSDSAKASTITLSDVYVTALRYVPEGAVTVKLLAAKDSSNNPTGSTALDKTNSDKSAGNVVVANCVTPSEGASAQFKIGSNVYTVNGVARIMDAAPYIKDNRTYVPIRYLAYALGVAESDVVWDAATSKVTITKGDKVVELTIGSTTITVNGAAQTMDVAPEIVNGRTMLPARYVAEGLGSTVAWDAATSTVFVQ